MIDRLVQDGNGDLIGVSEQVLKHTYISTGIKRKLVRFGMNCNQKGQIIWTLHGGSVTTCSSRKIISNPSPIFYVQFLVQVEVFPLNINDFSYGHLCKKYISSSIALIYKLSVKPKYKVMAVQSASVVLG